MSYLKSQDFNKRGFTLIELLVVISIIGILSTFGMVSLNGAREKAYDAQIKSDISNIRTTMYLCYDNNQGSYADCVVPDRFIPPICANMVDNKYKLIKSADETNKYVVYSNLCSQKIIGELPVVFCADYTGFSGFVSKPPEDQIKCQTE